MPRTTILAAALASRVQAAANCIKNGNREWERNHENIANELVKRLMPSGSGVDNGTHLDWDRSTGDKLVFTFGFHHMDQNGFYCGWTEHTAVVTPSFDGINLRITGRDRNGIKQYLHDLFHFALNEARENWIVKTDVPA